MGDGVVDPEDPEDGDEQEFDRTVTEDDEKERATAAKTREERLQNDLFVLRKLNGVFRVYNEALKETESGTERVTAQLEQTNALLDKYVSVLAKSELVTRLIFDERWQGAEADEEQIEIEVREAEEKRRKEEEERAMAAQLERERREREERERQAREEKERLERAKKEKLASKSTSGVRGIRGTRASMRASGARGKRAGKCANSIFNKPH
ncbi:hypothetical protein EWM64_g1151 [Hericium alpestre]|uniref:DASH complex subunit DUO1 n=1 Tax=Hericium alpestre TaxID=135208 RepID=A0A4Z0ABA4_9AGAM|nr:hypothetical protein EWM64_g1151 [Hericium alpestre]